MNAQNTAQQLYDIYPLWHVPFWQTSLFYTVIAIIGIIFLISGIYYFWKKRRKKNATIEVPWQRALRELRALELKENSTKDDGKQCYFAMTEILKRYLHARFHLPVQGTTDDELVRYLKDSKQLPELVDAIHDIAQGCIYIKFANEQAMQEQIARHLALSITLVTQTIPRESKK